MENNQVTLSLNTYNKLRDFEKNIKKNKTVSIDRYYGVRNERRIERVYYHTESKMVEKIAAANQELSHNIDRLKDQLKAKPKEITLEDVKKMTTREFKRWRRE